MSKWFTITVACCLIPAFSTIANSETIYLKSGEKVTGKIVGQSAKSVMLQEDGGGYKSYPMDEIKEIKKENVAEAPAATITTPQSVVDNKIVTGDAKTLVRAKDVAIKIALPGGYIPVNKKELDNPSKDLYISFYKKVSGEKFEVYGIFEIRTRPFDKEELKAGPLIALEAIKIGFKKGSVKAGSQFLSEENSEILEQPSIVMTYVPKDRTPARDIFFFKNDKLYQITFSCKRIENFDKEWPIVEQSLKTMEIQEVSQ